MNAPVIAIDGPSASGKGTVASRVAEALGFHYLESGALYRLVALASTRAGVAEDDENALARVASDLGALQLSSPNALTVLATQSDPLRGRSVDIRPTVVACPLPPAGLVGNNPDANSDGFADNPQPCIQFVDTSTLPALTSAQRASCAASSEPAASITF